MLHLYCSYRATTEQLHLRLAAETHVRRDLSGEQSPVWWAEFVVPSATSACVWEQTYLFAPQPQAHTSTGSEHSTILARSAHIATRMALV